MVAQVLDSGIVLSAFYLTGSNLVGGDFPGVEGQFDFTGLIYMVSFGFSMAIFMYLSIKFGSGKEYIKLIGEDGRTKTLWRTLQ